MIKQGVVQEKIADLSTTMNQLPPLSTLPQWSRVNTLDRGRYPKPFVKDKLQPIQDFRRGDNSEEDDREVDLTELNPAMRIHHLERSILFLRQQHQEVLKCLHDEIEALKKENKDLQFRIVMSHKSQQPTTTSASSRRSHKDRGHREPKEPKDGRILEKESSSVSMRSKTVESSREDRLDELKVIFLEEEIKELKHALREARNRNAYLTGLLEQAEETKKRQNATIETLRYQVNQGTAAQTIEKIAAGNNPFNQPGGPPPTLQECESIIRHLQQVNEKQSHELDRLKTDLRDVLYSHKWTPDAYLLAKAYVAEDDAKEQEKDKVAGAFPKLHLKNQSRKLPDIAYIQQDHVTLPALKNSVSNKAVERRKRTQILQKARLHREVIP